MYSFEYFCVQYKLQFIYCLTLQFIMFETVHVYLLLAFWFDIPIAHS
jgi:hypothetical protein